MDATERNEKIELYARGYASLAEALTEVPPDAIKFKPEPKEWSVHEIVVHLALREGATDGHNASVAPMAVKAEE